MKARANGQLETIRAAQCNPKIDLAWVSLRADFYFSNLKSYGLVFILLDVVLLSVPVMFKRIS